MTKQTQTYPGIDLMKLIMAVLVIAIHTDPLIGCPQSGLLELWESLTKTAVPFFFLCTGFFLGDRQEAVRRYLQKNIKLYALWSAIYAPLAIWFFISNHNSLPSAIVSYLCGFFLVGENYNSWMLWYLLSGIYALIFVLCLRKCRLRLPLVTLLGGICFLLGQLLMEFAAYPGSLPEILALVQRLAARLPSFGRLFTGFLYIPLGMLLSGKSFRPGTGIALFLLGILGDTLLAGLPGTLLRIAAAVGLFLIASTLPLKASRVYPALRKASTVLYFTHMYVWTAYYTLVYGQKTFGADSFLATTAICLLLWLLQHWLQTRHRNK